MVTLDGSKTSCAPANSPARPQAGIFRRRLMPHTFRRDYVENSNDSYWLSNPSHPLTGFSPIIGLTGTEQGLRTRIGNQMIAPRLAGTDGLGRRVHGPHAAAHVGGRPVRAGELILRAWSPTARPIRRRSPPTVRQST